MEIAKFDVTANDLVVFQHLDIVVPWLPEVWYFGRDTHKHSNNKRNNNRRSSITRYDRVDSFGDGVGGVNSPLELIDWLLDVGEFDALAMLQALEAAET